MIDMLCQRSGLRNPDPWLVKAFGGGTKTLAGTSVSEENQLEISVNLECINLISETIGSLRPNYKRLRKDGGYDVATDDPLQIAINIKPNDEMTGFTFRTTSTSHLAMYGNSYAYAPRNRLLQIPNIQPIHPDRILKRRANYFDILEMDPEFTRRSDIVYDITTGGKTKTYPAVDIMHTPGLSSTGLLGQPLVHFQKLKFGIGAALDEYEARWYGRGIHPSLIGETPNQMSNTHLLAHKTYLEEQYAGIEKVHGLMILDSDIKIRDITPKIDWQMLDSSQKRMATHICGLWRVPPSLIGILDRATFDNITQLDLQFGKYCIGIWTDRSEEQMMCDLLTDTQLRQGDIIEYPIQDLYKTDLATLNAALERAWDRGIISKNEWREKIGRNPVKNGNLFYVPSNYAVEGTVTAKPVAPSDTGPARVLSIDGKNWN